MATVFSTATLGLQVDTKSFNKQLGISERLTVRALQEMQQQAITFSNRWQDMTRGIKDTKRIISGILISQGFYALMNGLASATAAGLEFASSMEQAAVSLEYFVDAAVGTESAATQVSAYLREVNEFAARTPFNTNQILTLSKYMQAVGVEMSQTQSVLTVLTDAAAATGASTQQLERIAFALGQILTKGRLANEEIRQLANANVPIYEILQEEMGLTGAQISKIGKNWVNAEESVVAILSGLEKRYQGAADRIADTFAGVSDTIIDNTKIIANEAFGNVYDGMVNKLRSIRDTLDEWRTIVHEVGSIGLARHIALEIDPSGQFLKEVLDIVGHLKNLKESFSDLYHTAQPLLSSLGAAFPQFIKIATGAVTGFVRVAEQLVAILESVKIGGVSLIDVFTRFWVVYKSAKFVSLLGQAASAAAIGVKNAVTSVASLLPACISAQSGVVGLTSSVLGLVGALATVGALLSVFSTDFSGLGNNGTEFEAAYSEYAKKMEEYNKAIEAYRQNYQESYKEMSDGEETTVKKDDDDDDDDDKKDKDTDSGSKEWVASFDEVYDVPNEDDVTGGSTVADVVDGISGIADILADFKFPVWDKVSLEKPEMPEFFGPDLLKGDALDITWKNFLPALILGGAMTLGNLFKDKVGKIKGVDPGTGKPLTVDSPAIKVISIDNVAKDISTNFKKLNDLIGNLNKVLEGSYKNLHGALEATGNTTKYLESFDRLNRLIAEQYLKPIGALQETLKDLYALEGLTDYSAIEGNISDITRLVQGDRISIDQKKLAGLEQLYNNPAIYNRPLGELTNYQKQADALRKGLLAGAGEYFDVAFKDLAIRFDTSVYRMIEALQEGNFTLPKAAGNGARIYDEVFLRKIISQFIDLRNQFNVLNSTQLTFGEKTLGYYRILEGILGDIANKPDEFFTKLQRVNGYNTTNANLNAIGNEKLIKMIDNEIRYVSKVYDELQSVHTSFEKVNVRILEQQAIEAREYSEQLRLESQRLREEHLAEQRRIDAENERKRIAAENRNAIADISVRNELMYRDFKDLLKAAKEGKVDWGITARWLGVVDPARLEKAVTAIPALEEDLKNAMQEREALEQRRDALGKVADKNSSIYRLLHQHSILVSQLDEINTVRKQLNMAGTAGISFDEVKHNIELIAANVEKTADDIKKIADDFPTLATSLKAHGLLLPYGNFEHIKNRDALIQELKDIKSSILDRIRAIKLDTEGYSLNVYRKVNVLTEQLADAISLEARTHNELQELTALNKEFFRDATLSPIYKPSMVATGLTLPSTDLNKSITWQAYLSHALPTYIKAIESTKIALEAYQEALSDATKIALTSMGATNDALLLTGTTAIYAAKGLDSFGTTVPNHIAKILEGAGSYIAQSALPASEAAQFAADMGVAFEPLIRLAGAKSFAALGIETFAPGHAMANVEQFDAPLIVQFDSALSGLKNALGTTFDTAFADVKFFKDDIVRALLSGAKQLSNGIYKIDGSLLSIIGRDKLMYQMLAQGLVAGSLQAGTVSNFMMLMSRDVDVSKYVSKPEKFLREYQQYLTSNNIGHGQVLQEDLDAIGGRIFSDDAFKAFQKVAAGTAVTPMDYQRAVIDQLFANNSLSLEDLSKAVNKVQIIFDKEFVNAVNLPELARRAHDMYETFALIAADADHASHYLHSFARVVSDTTGALTSLDLIPTIRAYKPASNGLDAWAESILGVKGPSLGIGGTSRLAKYIDDTVTSYKYAIAAGKDISEAAGEFRNALMPIYTGVQKLHQGAKLTGEVGDLFGRATWLKSDEQFIYLKKALSALLEQPEILQETTRLINTVNGQINRLALDITNGSTDLSWSTRSLINNYRKLVDHLHFTADAAAMQLNDTLLEIQRYADAHEVVPKAYRYRLHLPFEIPGAAESMSAVAKEIGGALDAGVFKSGKNKLTDQTIGRLRQIFSAYQSQLPAAPIESLTAHARKLYTDKILGTRMLGLDIETTGLPTFERWPDISQIAVGDLRTGEMLESFINSGDPGRNRSILNSMMNIMDKGKLSEVSKSWSIWVESVNGIEKAVDVLNNSPTLEEFWEMVKQRFGTGNEVTGYNAVGAGSFDFNVLRTVGRLPEKLFVEGYDMMAQVTSKFEQALGVSPRLKLSELYQMLTGKEASGAAHMAGYDVGTELRTLYKAVNDGTFDAMLEAIKNNPEVTEQIITSTPEGFSQLDSPARKSLFTGAADWRAAGNIIEPVTGTIDIAPTLQNTLISSEEADALRRTMEQAGDTLDTVRIYSTSDGIVKAFEEGTDGVLEAFNDAQPKSIFRRLIDKISDSAVVRKLRDKRGFIRTPGFGNNTDDVTKGLFGRIKQGASNVFKWATDNNPFTILSRAQSYAHLDLNKAFEAYQAAFSEYDIFNKKLNSLISEKGLGAADEFIKSNQAIIDAYQEASTNVYRTMVTEIGQGLKSGSGKISNDLYEYIESVRKLYTSADIGTELPRYYGLYYDKVSEQIKLIGNQFEMSGEELYEAVMRYTVKNKLVVDKLSNSFKVLANTASKGEVASVALRRVGQLLEDTQMLTKSAEITEAFDGLKAALKTGDGINEAVKKLSTSIKEQVGRFITSADDQKDFIEQLGKTFKVLQGTAGQADSWDVAFESIRRGLANTTLGSSDEVAKAFSKLNKAIKSNGAGIVDATNELQTALSKAGGQFSDEVIQAATDIQRGINAGSLSADDIKRLKDAFQKAFGDFSVIMNASTNEVEYAGETATKVFSQAADDIAEGIGGFLKKISKATYGTLSWLDAVAIAVDVGLQAYSNSKYREFAGESIYNAASTEVQTAVDVSGIDKSDVLGGAVYRGVSEALVRSVAITALSTGIGTLTGALLATASTLASGPVGWIAAGAAAITAIGSNAAFNASGYNAPENLYYNEYIEAIQSGEFIDREALKEALEGKTNPRTGEVYTEKQINKFVDELNNISRMQSSRDVANELDSDKFWEKSKYRDIMYGGHNDALDLESAPDVEIIDTLRVAQAMGVLRGADHLTTEYNFGQGVKATESYLTANSEKALNDIRKMLGNMDLRFEEGNSGYVVDETGARIAYDSSNIDALEQVYQMILEQRALSGELVTEVLDTIRTTPELWAEYTKDLGYNLLGYYPDDDYFNSAEENAERSRKAQAAGRGVAFAQYNLDEVLAAFNEITGAGYTRETLAASPDLATEFTNATGQALNKWIEKTNIVAGYNFANRDKQTYFDRTDDVNQQVRYALGGIDLSSVPHINEMLGSFGFAVKGATETLLDGSTFDYSILMTNEEELWKNLRAVVIDTKSYAEKLGNGAFALDNLTVSASDAEILAQAGIKVYGNGDVAFAFNQNNHTERTGEQRTSKDLTVDKETGEIQELSSDVLKKAQNNGISIKAHETFDTEMGRPTYTGKVDLDLDMDKLRKNMSAAYFKMPSDLSDSMGTTMDKAIAEVGKRTEDGYLKITNKQILAGKATIKSVVESTKGAWDKLSPEIRTALENIDEIITNGNAQINEKLGISGTIVQENITTYADAISTLTDLTNEDITPEAEEFFGNLGVNFTKETELVERFDELGNTYTEEVEKFYANIDKTGEFYSKGMTLISADTWNQLDGDLRANLSRLLVNATPICNQMCIDVSKAMEEGAGSIVSAFVDQPELWAKMPEEVQKQFQEVGIISDDQLLEIQQKIDTKTGEISSGWVLSWSELGPAARNSLAQTSLETDTGLAQIVGIVEDADINKEVEDGIIVAFDQLPPEIQSALEETAGNLEGKHFELKSATAEALGGMKTELATTVGEFDRGAEDISKSIDKLKTAFTQLTAIQTNMGSGEVITGITENADGSMTVSTFDDADWIFGSDDYYEITFGKDGQIRKKEKATGGMTSGLTLTGEKGRELAIFPNGQVRLVGENGAELGDMPAGTRILNNKDTEDVLRNTGPISELSQYASGNTTLSMSTASGYEYGKEDDGLIDYFTSENSRNETRANVRSSQLQVFLDERFEDVLSRLDLIRDELSEGTSRITQPLQDTLEALGIAVTDTGAALQEGLSNALLSLGKDKTEGEVDRTLGFDWESIVQLAKQGWNQATTDEERKAWHAIAEMARATEGFSGGADGSEHILLKEAVGSIEETVAAMTTLMTTNPEKVEGLTWTDVVAAAQEGYANAVTDEEREAWHQVAELARSSQGFSGGDAGVDYIKLKGDPATLEQAVKALQEMQASTAKTAQTVETTAAEPIKTVSMEPIETVDGLSWQDVLKAANLGWSVATTDEERNVWSDLTEAARGTQNFISGPANDAVSMLGSTQSSLSQIVYQLQDISSKVGFDLSKFKSESGTGSSSSTAKPENTKGSAKGSLVTKDALYRAGEGGLNEAIIPLEQPDVMKQVGSTIASYVTLNKSDIPVIEATNTGTSLTINTNGLSVDDLKQVSNEAIKKEAANADIDLLQLSKNIDSRFVEVTEVLSEIYSVVSSIPDKIGTMSAASNTPPAITTGTVKLPGSGTKHMSAQEIINAAKTGWSKATTKEMKDAYHDIAERARATMGYSGGADGSGKITTKVSSESLNAIESALRNLNKTTGVTPSTSSGTGKTGSQTKEKLTNTDVIRQATLTAASFMPKNVGKLGAAIGIMADVGVGAMRHNNDNFDVRSMVDNVTKGVLERVLPAVATSNAAPSNDRTPINVGTLIADDAGLRMLERKLYTVRQAENMRRGH